MNPAIARRLADLNRQFYAEHAVAFAHRRLTPQPGIARVLGQIPSGARVLEIGCGDGKVAQALRVSRNAIAYWGLDLDPTLLARARQAMLASAPPSSQPWSFTFALADLTAPDWARVLPPEPFHWILAFSVFHHLPGSGCRQQVLRTLGEHLAPGGTLAMSNWQFMRSERLKARVRPWSSIGLTAAEVEPHDYLLDWERSGRHGLRYVHLLEEAEARALAESAALKVIEVFQSDGVTGTLADYVL